MSEQDIRDIRDGIIRVEAGQEQVSEDFKSFKNDTIDNLVKVIFSLIALVGGVVGVKLLTPIQSGVGVAGFLASSVSVIDWNATLYRYSQLLTIFTLIFVGLRVMWAYWRNGYNRYLAGALLGMAMAILIQMFLNPNVFSVVLMRVTYDALFLIYAFKIKCTPKG